MTAATWSARPPSSTSTAQLTASTATFCLNSCSGGGWGGQGWWERGSRPSCRSRCLRCRRWRHRAWPPRPAAGGSSREAVGRHPPARPGYSTPTSSTPPLHQPTPPRPPPGTSRRRAPRAAPPPAGSGSPRPPAAAGLRAGGMGVGAGVVWARHAAGAPRRIEADASSGPHAAAGSAASSRLTAPGHQRATSAPEAAR